MTRYLPAATAALMVLGGSYTVAADDEKKPAAKAEAPTAADWSGYSKVSEVSGEIMKADDKGFTLRVTWYTTSSSGGGRGGRGGGGGMAAYQSLMNGQTPHRRSGGSRPPRVQEHHEDYDLTYADAGMVRWDKLSQVPSVGGKGTFVPPAEQTRLKLPYGAPGYAGDRGDLQNGHIVQVTLVRPKEVPLSKVTQADLKVKYVEIQGMNPNPSSPDKKK